MLIACLFCVCFWWCNAHISGLWIFSLLFHLSNTWNCFITIYYLILSHVARYQVGLVTQFVKWLFFLLYNNFFYFAFILFSEYPLSGFCYARHLHLLLMDHTLTCCPIKWVMMMMPPIKTYTLNCRGVNAKKWKVATWANVVFLQETHIKRNKALIFRTPK